MSAAGEGFLPVAHCCQGVEGVELLVGGAESVVVAVEASAELLVAPVLALELVSFVS